ncbi:nose resistant to fluoxetine protein 6-like isoform X2 [Schistocerca cancellata]|uniref:nose resistant to fluoxetine protein 6-like isoform X2 n=1 Tax=Schistocerca cancellata TaxID=274614 RepID=UPI0021197B3A|nr:nose resistant to fluoxetine protein 6-like isoform X2 [Schistocerca cancellata]
MKRRWSASACVLLLLLLVDAARATDCDDTAAPTSLGLERAARRNLSKGSGQAAEQTAPRWDAVGSRALFATQDDHDGEDEVSPETLLAVADEEREESNEDNVQSRTLKGSIFEHLPVFSLANSKINNSLCVRHSRIFLHELKKYRLWALQMFDGGAKLGSGLLRGSATHLGDYDECVAVSARLGPPPASERVRGQYCLLAVDVEVDPSWSGPRAGDLHTAVDRAVIYRVLWSSRFDPSHFVPRASTVGWAVCVPASCSPADVERAVGDALAPYNGSAYGLAVGVRAEPHQCYTRPQGAPSRLPPLSTLLAISALVSVGIIAIIASLRDMSETPKRENHQGNGWKLVQSFSLYRTWAELIGALSPDRNIVCIFGLRALLAIVLYIEHAIIPLARTPYTNRVDFLEQLKMPITVALRTGSHCTDSFLLMSGVLAAYTLTRELQSTGKIKWLKWLIGRYIRLTPALIAFVLVSGYIMDHLGEGPMWGEVINQNSQLCKQYGWRNLLYMQNFFAFEDMCGPHTHHLAIDMQLSLFLPLMLYLLHMNAVAGTVVLFSINAVSTWLRFSRTVEHNLSIVIFHSVKPSQLYRTANIMYGLPLPRASPYIFGVLLGFYMKKMEKSLRIPKVLVATGWIVAIVLASCSMLLAKNVYKLSYVYNVYEAATFAAWAPLAWSSALCWIILACHSGYAGKLNNVLSWRPLVILSRLSYALYMIQFPVFYYYVGINRSAKVFTVMSSFFPLQGLTVVIILSVIFTLLFDLPMHHVKNILMRGSQRTEKEQTKEKCS